VLLGTAGATGAVGATAGGMDEGATAGAIAVLPLLLGGTGSPPVEVAGWQKRKFFFSRRFRSLIFSPITRAE